MKTWLVIGIVLMIGGLVAVGAGFLRMSDIPERATAASVAQGISNSMLWTMSGFAISEMGLFLTIVAGIMYLFSRTADTK